MPAPRALHLSLRLGAAIALWFLAGATASADITVPSRTSVPPQAEALSVRVWRGQATRIELRAHYAGGNAVQFEIVRRPAHGQLSEPRDLGDNRAVIIYTHDGNAESARDSFSYIVRAGSQVSAVAEVGIQVDEPAPRLVIPGEIDFGKVMAGELATRSLSIRNAGGGTLQGRLTASSPWALAPAEYQVGAGASEEIQTAFRPHEARKFVGQITLASDAGGTASVSLTGMASAPLRIEPSPVLLRSETVTLRNETNRKVHLRFQTSPNLKPISAVEVAAKGEARVAIEVRPEVSRAIQENVMIAGPGFTLPLPIDAPALEPKVKAQAVPHAPQLSPKSTPNAAPSIVSAVHRIEAAPAPTPVADRSPEIALNSTIRVTARREDFSHWELQWPVEKEHAAATYRVEERVLSLDQTDNLLTSWRKVPAKIATIADHLAAQVGPLDAHQLHMLRVTAVAPDGSILWEAPLIALQPEPAQAHGHAVLLVALGLLLAVGLYFRWRA